MKDCYNGYEEMHLTGSQLKNLFRNSFYCTGRHHESMISLPIPVFLETLNIKNDKTYRIFYNNCFCKIMNVKTDDEITFFGHGITNLARHFSEEDLHIPNCPLCNSEMKLRISQYGEFWGCSKYPDCKGKLQIDFIKSN